MLRNELIAFSDFISPVWGIFKWQLFAQLILRLSKLEIRLDDTLMYLPAVISSIDNLINDNVNPQFALHSALATVHNLRGHRFLPYVDPKNGYHCNLSPAEDVFYHACMLAFVDDAVHDKFPTKSLNKVYNCFSWLMKGGIAYSLYLSLLLELDPEACQTFIPSLATSSVPAGTMFSLLTMWNFPFNHSEKYSKNQLLAYTAVFYIISIATGLLLFYEFKTGNTFAKEGAGKYFESFFIAGGSLQGLELIDNFLWEKISKMIKIPDFFKENSDKTNIHEKSKTNFKTTIDKSGIKSFVNSSTKSVKNALSSAKITNQFHHTKSKINFTSNPNTVETIMPNLSTTRRVSFCQRFGKFAINVGTTIAISLGLSYMNRRP
jgi:hypothetical protein